MFAGWFSDPLPVGAAAPDFALKDDAGTMWRLGELRGKNVLLVFYPADDTPGCTKQLCEMRDKWAKLTAKNAVGFGVNPGGEASHQKFRARFNFPFPLLIDEGKRVAGLYNSGGLFVRRTVYLIGPDGKIAFAKRGMPSVEDVMQFAR